MTMQYIRDRYKVPAKRGGRIKYTGSQSGQPRMGTITSASRGYLNIRLDGHNHSMPYHPTWKLEYLP